ncbi:MAG: hypothetical protein ACR2FV_08085 [Ornithinimicrobium sp.]|uniref:hypothetical protein n=1 Tax=Ornithinimicrobium sp. TaxID=1977084 RepID=UPI003D9B4E66
MFESEENQRRIGRFAWVMAWVGLVVGQLHALSRYATTDGQEDLELPLTAAWANPATELLAPLLTWANPDVVYVTYGKIWFPVFAAFTLCAYVVYQRRQPSGSEKWVWRFALTGYTIACVAVFLEYWTQWTGSYNGDGIQGLLFSFAWVVILPGLLLTLLGSTALGITLLLKRFRPALAAWLLAAMIPFALVILQVTSMGSVALPVMFAFAILGRRIARTAALTKPAASHHATLA